MDIKIGDFVFANDNYNWYSTSDDRFHKVSKKEQFQIIGKYFNSGSHIEVHNVLKFYNVIIQRDQFDKSFDIKMIRKEKLKKLYESDMHK